MVDQQVARQPPQPHGKGALAGAEILERAEHPQKDFLRQILGVLVGAGKTVGDGVHAPRMRPDQVVPGGRFPAEAPLDELAIGVQ